MTELIVAGVALSLGLALWAYLVQRDIPLNWPNHATCRHCGGALHAVVSGSNMLACRDCECTFDSYDETVAIRGEGCPGA